jgi:hypothetical protein
MTSFAAMAADTAKPKDPGAPFPKGEIDPELVDLKKDRPPIRVVTATGVAILCTYLVIRLLPDLAFSRQDDKPVATKIDKLTDDAFVEVQVPLERARAVRVRQDMGGAGMRAAPVAGTNNKLWIVMTGDGWGPAVPEPVFTGRVRAVDDVPFADALRAHVAGNPAPAFATLDQIRAAFAGGELATIHGDKVRVAPGDAVELEVPVPDAAELLIRFNEKLPSPAAWVTALEAAGISASAMRDITEYKAKVDVKVPDAVAATTAKLAAAKLYVPEINPVRKTVKTTWGELAKAGAGPVVIGGETIDDARIDLVQVTVARAIPADARLVLVGEVPEQYWYVLYLSIALALLGAMAVWALVRAIKRDYLSPQQPAAAEAEA